MRKLLLTIVCPITFWQAFSQNPISNDGKYVQTSVNDLLIVQSTTGHWRTEINNGSNAIFTTDSRHLFFKKNDSLGELQLGGEKIKYIRNVSKFKLMNNGVDDWLIFTLKEDLGRLIIKNLRSGDSKDYKDVIDYFVEEGHDILLLKRKGTLSKVELQIGRLGASEPKMIWSDNDSLSKLKMYAFSKSKSTLAFIVQHKNSATVRNSIWFYKEPMLGAEIIVSDKFFGKENQLTVSDEFLKVTDDGRKILFNLVEKTITKPDSNLNVEIWSYTDPVLQPQQRVHNKPRSYCAVVKCSDKSIIRLQRENECLIGMGYGADNIQMTNDYILICQFEGDIFYKSVSEDYLMSEYNWNGATMSSIFLVSINDGSRKLLKKNMKANTSGFPKYEFSPKGQYVLYYDQRSGNYFTYQISSGSTCNVTRNIQNCWEQANDSDLPRDYFRVASAFDNRMSYWSPDDASFCVYDSHSDVWLFDPTGERSAVNITNGYARKNRLRFTVKNSSTMFGDNCVLLFAKRTDNYNQAIFVIRLDDPKIISRIIDGPYRVGNIYSVFTATHTVCLFSKESFKETNATYYTTDLKTLHCVASSLNANKLDTAANYELVSWKSLNNKKLKGFLFKPDQFDSTKKYPVIISFYEGAASLQMNKFISRKQISLPDYTDVDYCLSHGYLIFLPDIDFTISETGISFYNSIVSAAKVLSKLQYVDARKIGITGESFGSYGTNYLVTHSQIFAAAVSTAGATDFISYFGTQDLDRSGYSYTSGAEEGQWRLAVTPWDRPDVYVKNSPIFYANRVTAPILLIANKDDYRVPVSQSIELFTALRRLGKKAWLILGEKGGHGAPEVPYKMQFFDHYLKDAPAPKWMLRPVPYREQGNAKWLELDSTERTPQEGLLMENEGALTPQQKELLKRRTRFNDDGWIEEVPTDKPKKLKPKINK